MSEASTPLMRQHAAIKKEHPTALLFFRVGDFYELFLDDAVTASRELQITLTSRQKVDGVALPMCGVPYHAAEGYISKLIRKGYKVAICDQVEDPKLTKKLVRREVTRVVTPGTAADSQLGSEENNFLCAVARHSSSLGCSLGFAALDLSTGEFRATEFSGPDADRRVADELQTLRPRELLYAASLPLFRSSAPQPSFAAVAAAPAAAAAPRMASTELAPFARWSETPLDDWIFATDYAIPLVENHFGVLSLEGFGLARPQRRRLRRRSHSPLRPPDSARIARPRRPHQLLRAPELPHPRRRHRPQPRTDRAALCRLRRRRNALPRPRPHPHPHGQAPAARLDAAPLHRCRRDRPAPRRRRRRPRQPHSSRGACAARSMAFSTSSACSAASPWRRQIRATFSPSPHRSPSFPRCAALWRTSLPRALPPFGICSTNSPTCASASSAPSSPSRPSPSTMAESSRAESIRNSTNSATSAATASTTSPRSSSASASAPASTRSRSKFNNVFGFYIEISKANLQHAPADYERKQTLVGAERFTTPELKEYETKVLDAEEKIVEIERRLFTELRLAIAAESRRIRQSALALAEIDVLLSFAHLAALRNYCRPQFDGSAQVLEILEGRHPVIEQPELTGSNDRFVPNDLYLDAAAQSILLITGPNMGGKSTYLRQTALIVLMAQMGSFVPATRARLSTVDRIFTRIGASDNLARGRSTFMVEMTETAAILNTATPRSLILLDEIGRGTATYDGLAIAWAVVEFIHQRSRAKTLFATHYHELTELEELLDSVKNYHVSVKETGGSIVFLRKVSPGAADKSYGIEVAKLAGLPAEVISRAREVLHQHENAEHTATTQLAPKPEKSGPVQLTIFTPVSNTVLDRLREADLDSLSPREAMNLLYELKKQVD